MFTGDLLRRLRMRDARCYDVLVRRLGLDGHEPEGTERVATALGVHRNTVTEVYREAVDRLRADLDLTDTAA